MVESEKLPLDQIFVIGNGCSSPLRYYYECHTAGALETVLTRDDSSIAGEQCKDYEDDNDDDENNDPEPSALFPLRFNSAPNRQPHKPKTKRPHTVLGKTNQSVSTPSTTENGLLATAKGERASSCVVGMLEAHKRQNFENHSNSSSKKTPKKEKKQHKRSAVTIPIYTSYKNVEDGNMDEGYGCSQVPPSTTTPESLRAIEAMKIAAAAKWRAAKKRHFASTSATKTKTASASSSAFKSAPAPENTSVSAPASASILASATASAPAPTSAPASPSRSRSPSAFVAAPEQPKPEDEEDDVCAQSHPGGGTSTVTDANSVDRSRSRRQAVDPPEDLLKLPTVGAERKSAGPLVVDASLLNHQMLREKGLGGGETNTTPTTSSPPLFRKFSEALRQMEDQQEAHKFRLFEQRLRHQKWKTHLKERVAALSAGLRPSLVMGEEHKITSTEKWKEETKVVEVPIVPAVYLIPVEPCQ